MPLLRRPLASIVLLAVAACGGGDLVLPNEGQPADVVVVSGNGQTGTILEPLPDSLVVKVTDRFGNPVAGVEVTWAAEGGGDVQPATATTGPDGRAATQRILGAQPGSYGTTALVTLLPEDVASFTTTAVAAKLVLVTQPGATATSGGVIDPQPVLQLQDASGNPAARPGVAVTVQIASGGGTLQGTTTQTSDGDGRVTFTDIAIAGGPGARTLIFAASGYASAISTPVSLGVGAPASAAAAAGDGQSAVAGTAVPVAPAVLVTDAGGTPVAGVAVKFAVASGGGSVTGADAVTGADGVAAAGSWTLGGAAGPNTLRATVAADGVAGNPVTFTATATPGTPNGDRSTVDAGPGSIVASDGSAFSTITVVVRDSRGNALPGQSVTLSVTGSGVTLTQPGPTDGAGTTTGRLSGTAAGRYSVAAATGGVSLGQADVTITAAAPAPERTSVQVPDGRAGQPTQVQLTLADQFGNPVAGAAGQVSVKVSGANSGDASVSDAGGGAYRATYTPSRLGTDQVEVRVGGQPVPGSPFTSTVTPGPGDPAHTTADVSKKGSFFQPVEVVVQVKDSEGNPVGHGGDAVAVRVTDENDRVVVAEPRVEDGGNGTYSAEWAPGFTSGRFHVHVTLGGTEIAESPFTTDVRPF
jgi:adhesin/invasin